MEAGKLTNILRRCCLKVEFPIEVNDLGKVTTIEAERKDQFIYEIQDITEREAKFVVKCFPIDRSGLEGEIYVFTHITKRGETWADWHWAQYTYPNMHPQAVKPKLLENSICENGITTSSYVRFMSGPLCVRVDYRGRQQQLSLSKTPRQKIDFWIEEPDPEIESRCEEILLEHLLTSPFAAGDVGWIYKQKLVHSFPYSMFWKSIPNMIRVIREGKPQYMSLQDNKSVGILTTVMNVEVDQIKRSALQRKKYRTKKTPVWDNNEITLIAEDIKLLSDSHRSSIFENRCIDKIRWL